MAGGSSCLSFVSLYGGYLRRCFAAAGLSSQTVDISDETTLHFWGPQHRSHVDKPTLVLIHGFGPAAMWQWRRQVGAFAARFHVYVPDLVFFGGSVTTSTERTEGFQAECVGRLMEAVGAERYSVVGTSYGGFVAYRMAEMLGPERVERVVVASSAVNMVRGDEAALLRRGRAERVEELMLPRTAAELRTLIGLGMFKPPSVVPTFLLNDFLDKLYSDNRKEKVELLKGMTIGRHDTPKVSPLNQEVLIVWGEHDQIFLVEKAAQLKKLLGEHTKLEVIAKSAHMPQVENSGKFNKIVLDFLCGSA